MTDNIFLDTNIIVYDFLDDDLKKHNAAQAFLSSLVNHKVYISTQVLSEVYSALKKNGVSDSDTAYYVNYCIEKYNILPVTLNEITTCLAIRDKYNFSYWDCLILAAALNNGCGAVYSEDMQDGQSINGALTIVNPLA